MLLKLPLLCSYDNHLMRGQEMNSIANNNGNNNIGINSELLHNLTQSWQNINNHLSLIDQKLIDNDNLNTLWRQCVIQLLLKQQNNTFFQGLFVFV